MFVSVGESLFVDICSGSGADLAIAAQADDRGPDEPSEGNSAEESIKYSDQNGKRLDLLKLVDDFDEANDAADQGDNKASIADRSKLFRHVVTITLPIGLSLFSGKAVPVGSVLRGVVVHEVAEDADDGRL